MGLTIDHQRRVTRTPDELLRFLNSDRTSILFNPEYQQKHFFFTIPSDYISSQQIISEQARIAREALGISHATRYTIFVPTSADVENVRNAFIAAEPQLERMQREGRIEFRVGRGISEIWGQDLGESVLKRSGGSEFIVGITANRAVVLNPRQRSPPISPGEYNMPVTQIPLVFEGGDISTTTVNGRRVVVVGPQTVALTRAHYDRNMGYAISDDQIKEVLRRAFSADDVLLLRSPQGAIPTLAFHLDQAVFFPRDGVAVMINPDTLQYSDPVTIEHNPDIAQLRVALTRYREQLRQAGFVVIQIPSNPEHVSEFQAYTNAIPITRADGSTTVIMPSFGDAQSEAVTRQILGNNGIGVVFVPNTTFEDQGNTHCMTGALARADDRRIDGAIPRRIA